MMTNDQNSVLYIGVTNNLIRRVYEHRNMLNKGFTHKYKCKKLVWYEQTGNIKSAIQKEKSMKGWKRGYKENVINEMNPKWDDLYESLL